MNQQAAVELPMGDHGADLRVVCLAKSGRWDEIEPLVADMSVTARSPETELAIGSARARAGKWDEAIRDLVEASRRFPSSRSLRDFTLRLLNARAHELIRTRQWPEAAELVGRAIEIDPENAVALQKRRVIRAAVPAAGLQSGDRAETAALWEREFLQGHETETAHHLAVLFYWWAASETERDPSRVATLWHRCIGWWVYVLNDTAYLSDWAARKKPFYTISPEMIADLRSSVRKLLDERIASLSASPAGISQRVIDDLAMDCWAEFEIAGFLRECGAQRAYGPLLMDLLGPPQLPQREGAAAGARLLRLGDCVLPFIPDARALLRLCRSGLSRALAYLATGRHDRAMSIAVGRLGAIAGDDGLRVLVTDMCGYIEIRHAEDVYIRLKCPPENADYERIDQYASEVRAVMDGLTTARAQIRADDTRREMDRLVELIGRRTYNEFASFTGDAGLRSKILEAGIGLLDRAQHLAIATPTAEEIRLYLAAMVNRLALHIAGDEHDRVITLLERAVQWAPDNPNYRRNLAFSYFNRYASRKQRDSDRLAAREDILKAHRLAPYDPDIRAEYELMHGSGRG
jgi:tetratricopeptide (TPR) repeat protein